MDYIFCSTSIYISPNQSVKRLSSSRFVFFGSSTFFITSSSSFLWQAVVVPAGSCSLEVLPSSVTGLSSQPVFSLRQCSPFGLTHSIPQSRGCLRRWSIFFASTFIYTSPNPWLLRSCLPSRYVFSGTSTFFITYSHLPSSVKLLLSKLVHILWQYFNSRLVNFLHLSRGCLRS